MAKRKKAPIKPQIPLDTFSRKRGRGRPRKVIPTEIRGRADNYRWIFNEIWDHLWPQLSKAQNEEDVKKAFEQGASPYDKEFMPYMASLVLKVLRESKFPKRRVPQINFLADSLAGVDWVSPRRARDICDQERKKKVNYIIRQDYYIECTCRYKGPALHRKCPKCGTDELDLPYSKFQM